jgi:AcrR family transcriptional regulator
MPRVSDEYLEQRRQQILDAASRCFARKGFYETSMQDVFRESGLSAGAVYRYFKSKNDLIRAISGRTLARVAGILEGTLAEDPAPGLDEIAGRLAAAVQELSGEEGPARIGPAAWAVALYDPGVAVIVRDVLGELRGWWLAATQRLRDAGRLPPGADVDAVGATLVAMQLGFLLQHLILDDVDDGTVRRGLRQLLRQELLMPDPR